MSLAVDTTSPIMDTYLRWPVEFVRGTGSTLFDSNGKSYIDMVAGLAVANVGHAHPKVAQAIADQASTLVHVSNLYETRPQQELAARLAEISGGMRSFFCNSGAESIECALKLARRWTNHPSPRVIATQGSFHGRTFGALAATGQPAKQKPFAPMLPGFAHVPFGDIAPLEQCMGDDVAAVIVESIQGEGGVIVPPADYLPALRDLCDRYSALVIIDEIQTGMGRTGRWYAYEHSGIVPDVVCMAKGLAGGLPIGACLAQSEVASSFVPGDHASTFGGGPVQCVAALATIAIIEEEGLLGRATSAGERLRFGLQDLFGEESVRGVGLMLAVQLPDDSARKVCELALGNGLLINDVAPHSLRFVPPLVITDAEIDDALNVLKEVWDETQKA